MIRPDAILDMETVEQRRLLIDPSTHRKSSQGLPEDSAIPSKWQRGVFQHPVRRTGDDERSRAIRVEGHFKVALLWSKLGRYEEARAENESARELAKQLVEQFPDQPKYRSALASISLNLGNDFDMLGMRDEARAAYQLARGLQKTLVEQFPNVVIHQKLLALTQNGLGLFLESHGQRTEALEAYQSALELERKLVEQFPDEPDYRFSLAGTYVNLGTPREAHGGAGESQAVPRFADDVGQAVPRRATLPRLSGY